MGGWSSHAAAGARAAGSPTQLPGLEIKLYRNGELVDRGVGENVLGARCSRSRTSSSPAQANPRRPPLVAGELITTGTLTGCASGCARETWTTQIRGLPLHGLKVSFE